jgi:hypothetical protein
LKSKPKSIINQNNNMKTFFLSLLLLAGFRFAASAQDVSVPGTMNYQAVARDATGKTLPNKTIKLRLSIVTDGGADIEYTETRSVTTNALGLFSVVMGSGGATNVVGTLREVDWVLSPALHVELDINNGTNFVKMGEQLLTTSPFAFHAEKAHWAESVAPRMMYNFLYESTVSQTLAVNAPRTTVSFETKRQEETALYNTTTHEFYILETGLYYLYSAVRYNNPGAKANLWVSFVKNNEGIAFYSNFISLPAATENTHTLSTIYQLNKGDKIKVTVTPSNISQNITIAGGNTTYFGGYRIQ